MLCPPRKNTGINREYYCPNEIKYYRDNDNTNNIDKYADSCHF